MTLLQLITATASAAPSLFTRAYRKTIQPSFACISDQRPAGPDFKMHPMPTPPVPDCVINAVLILCTHTHTHKGPLSPLPHPLPFEMVYHSGMASELGSCFDCEINKLIA